MRETHYEKHGWIESLHFGFSEKLLNVKSDIADDRKRDDRSEKFIEIAGSRYDSLAEYKSCT